MRVGCQPYHHPAICMVIVLMMVAVGCSAPSVLPAPVVPTKSPVPYTAQVRVTELDAYVVEPGATLRPVSNLRNSVTQANAISALSREAWDTFILEYLTGRQTFRRVVADGPADVALTLQLFIFIDPGAVFKFRHNYVAEADAMLKDPRNGTTLGTYVGFGKALGAVSRDSREDDEGPINTSVQRALNDLFGKIESDKRNLP